MMTDRRDPRRRGQILARLVEWLREQSRPAPAVPPEIARPDAARRILRQLAVRALVRREEGGWVARASLKRPPALVLIQADV